MKFKLLVAMMICSMACSLAYARTDDSKWCGTKGPQMTEYMIKQHEFRKERGEIPPQRPNAAPTISQVGNIVVMKANPRNFITLNSFDLVNKKIAFTRNPQGGFNMKVSAASLGPISGTVLQLDDDDAEQVPFTGGFSFPFFGTTYNSAFVNSDGNITFKEMDTSISARDVFRVISGPPRIAPFFQDMNPRQGGFIKVVQSSTKFTVSWDQVSQYSNVGKNSNTFQISLYKNGNIDLIFGAKMDTKDGIVGISAGNTSVSNMKLINYSSQTTLTGVKNTAMLERFASKQEIDWSGMIQEFHETYPSEYEFMVVYSDFPQGLGGNAFAFFSHIQNSIKGIGLEAFNYSRFFGAPKIEGFLAMGWLGKYPDDLNQEFLFSNSTLEIMGQENGHRWLAFPEVTINGADTLDLLGRDDSHWNFYLDSDASCMEGNDIVENSDGTFTTVQSNETFSKLDQYIMGLLPPTAVPPFFFVSGNSDKGRPPQPNVVVRGTKVTANIQQVIQANGPRVPASAQAPKKWKEVFVLFTKVDQPLKKDLDKIEKIRAAWTAFFKKQTGNRGTIDTTVKPPTP